MPGLPGGWGAAFGGLGGAKTGGGGAAGKGGWLPSWMKAPEPEPEPEPEIVEVVRQ